MLCFEKNGVPLSMVIGGLLEQLLRLRCVHYANHLMMALCLLGV